MKDKNMKVSIVMPCFNEEEAITHTLEQILQDKIQHMGYEVEIIVVDGESTDRSAFIAKDKGAKVIISPRNYGLQYKIGLKEAKGEVIIACDSDGSYPLDEIPTLLNTFCKEELDFVSINRFVFIEPNAMFLIRKMGNKLLTFITNLLFSLNLKDSQSGMWIFKKEILDKINLTSDGMSFSEEIKIEAFKKVKAKELPGSYKRRNGKSKLRLLVDGLDNILFLFKKFFHDMDI